MSTLRALALCLTVVGALLATPLSALAHPLGNFTVNQYARVEVATNSVKVRYVVDMAEIPTFQEMAGLDRDGDGRVGDGERATYLSGTGEELRRGIRLTVDSQPVELQIASADLALQTGQAGLQTLRLTLELVGDLSVRGERLDLTFHNDNYPGRLGWREVVVRAGEGASLLESTAPTVDVSDELRSYPDDYLSSPPDAREAWATFGAGAARSAHRPTAETSGARQEVESRVEAAVSPFGLDLTDLVLFGQQGGLSLVLGLVLAAAWGASHAFSPGHGKTAVAAYLVGSRGTARHALYLGLTVTATHTLGVYAFGLITLLATQFVVPERLYPWLSLIAGLSVVLVGGSLLVRRTSELIARNGRGTESSHHGHLYEHQSSPHRHSHVHGDADQGIADQREHEAAHGHDGHGHSHLPPIDDASISWRSLLALGIAGGLLPCPSALVLLLATIAAGKVAFGLVLVVAFSLGLAATLTALGIAVVYAGHLLSTAHLPRFAAGNQLRGLSLCASALAISAIGVAMTLDAVERAGLLPL